MSQVVYSGNIDPNTTSGTALAALIDGLKFAILTGNSGSSEPTYKQVGTTWLDNATAGSIIIKIYDGTQWVSQGTVDTAAHTISLGGNNATASVTISRTDTAADMIEMFRNQPTAANGGLIYTQINDNAIKRNFGAININADSVADTAEIGSVSIDTMVAGSLTEIFRVSSTLVRSKSLEGIGTRSLVASADGTISAGSGSGAASYNLFDDGNAETGDETNYTTTGLGIAKSTTSTELIERSKVFKVISTAGAETLVTPLIATANAHIESPMIVSVKYRASASWTIQLLDQADAVLRSETIEAYSETSNEANSHKLFSVLESGVTGVKVKFISSAVDTLLFDDLEVYSLMSKEEPLFFSSAIDDAAINTTLFRIANRKNSMYKIEAQIVREDTLAYADAVYEGFISYDTNGTVWRFGKEDIYDHEADEVETTFNMNGTSARYSTSTFTGASYSGKIKGKITRIL